jgi:hypothetical protein
MRPSRNRDHDLVGRPWGSRQPDGALDFSQWNDVTYDLTVLLPVSCEVPGSKAAGLAMAYKLIEAAQDRWRSVNAPHLVALIRAGAKFDEGVMIERPTEQHTEVAA